MNIQRKSTMLLSILLSGVLAFSCANSNPDDNHFFVEHKGAIMPVWVSGNTASNTFMIFLHGGPGDTCQYIHYLDEFKNIEKDVAVVYWDQRNSGHSQGNPDPSTFTIEQMTEDLKVVIEAVKSQYQVNSLFAIGVSWGGQLGSHYLASPHKDPLFKGWIDVDGGMGFSSAYDYSRQYMLNKIPEKLADNTLSQEKRKLLEEGLIWYQNTPVMPDNAKNNSKDFYNFLGLKHARYVQAAGGYEYSEGVIQKKIFTLPIFDPTIAVDLLYIMSAPGGLWGKLPDSSIPGFVNDADLSKITIPTLYLWGRHDGILPVTYGQLKFSRLTGVATADKSMVIFESSAHSPYIEEGPKFESEVRTFLAKYK